MLFTVISIALAQPAKIDKGNVDNLTQVDTLSTCQETRDDLYVEILTRDGFDFPGGYHFPNDSSLLCPLERMHFKTNCDFSYLHTWETSLNPDDYTIFEGFFNGDVNSSCYIKVTVTDNDGNTGTDSIYFNIKDWITPPDNFEMEIVDVNGILNANFSFMPSSDTWFFGTYVSQDSINHNPNIPYPEYEGWIYYNGTQLYQGSYLDNFIISYYNYNENTVWNVLTEIWDTCAQTRYDVFPGMYLSTENSNDSNFLKFKTSLQSGDHDEYVYTIFTVDSNGIRYPFIVDDEQIILPSNTINYELPTPHEHPYYQCAVASVTDDGDYKILSYSNKVANPYNSTVNVGEYEDFSFQIYPNPAKNYTTITGMGTITVTNILGQVVMAKEIDGQTTVALPRGLYFATMNGTTKKIVVE